MNNFKDIVSRNNGWVSIEDLVGYKKIGREWRVYFSNITWEMYQNLWEGRNISKWIISLSGRKSSSVIPTLYEYGRNYIVIEFINGPSLRHYLKNEKELSESTAQKLLFMLDEFKRIGFTRLDTQIRHIFINELGK